MFFSTCRKITSEENYGAMAAVVSGIISSTLSFGCVCESY